MEKCKKYCCECEKFLTIKNSDGTKTYNECEIDGHKIGYAEAVNTEKKWIPCSERLPEELEDVLVWYEYYRYGEYNCLYQTYGIGHYIIGREGDPFWCGDVTGRQARCIAWMPLPESYKENNNA